MEHSNLIAIKTFCESHEIGSDFVYSICETGLIELVKIEAEEDDFIAVTQLSELEKTVRLHKDLHINQEGIAAVFELLERVEALNKQVNTLRNRLGVYEKHLRS